jgi:hypothetical protein
MSGPLFIRTPKIGSNASATGGGPGVFGQTLPPSAIGDWSELFYQVEEPTLVESLRACAHFFSTEAGQILIGLKNEEYGGGEYVYIVGALLFPAGVADPGPFASLDEDVDITIPAGFSLVVAHNVKASGGMSFTTLDVTAHGGVVR